MIFSREETVGLFNKWKTESTQLVGILVGDVAVTFSGVITELDSSGLVVSQSLFSGRKAVEVVIGLHSVKSYNHQDLREAPPQIRENLAGKVASVLEMTFDASRILLYEKPRD